MHSINLRLHHQSERFTQSNLHSALLHKIMQVLFRPALFYVLFTRISPSFYPLYLPKIRSRFSRITSTLIGYAICPFLPALIAFLQSYLCKKTASIIRLRYTMHKKNITAQYLYLPMHISDIKCNLIGQSLFRRFQLISQNFPDISDTVQHRIAMRIQFCCHSLNTSIMLQI